MKDAKIAEVLQEMLPYLDNSQMEQLQRVLQHTFWNCSVEEKQDGEPSEQTPDMVDLFLASKRVEGCSEKTLTYYKATIEASINEIGKQIRHITTEDLRSYLTEYQRKRHSSRVTIVNIRRILSSFFSWLEDEDYILKSPVRRIHRVKTSTVIKETYTDEALETMRDNSHTRILSREEFEALFEDAFELQLEETTLVPVNLQSWMDLTSTPEDIQKDIIDKMEYDLNGGDKTGFNPYIKEGQICFDHRWLLLIGKKEN